MFSHLHATLGVCDERVVRFRSRRYEWNSNIVDTKHKNVSEARCRDGE